MARTPFNVIRATTFFTKHCPGIASWRNKLARTPHGSGYYDFTEEEKKKINRALKALNLTLK